MQPLSYVSLTLVRRFRLSFRRSIYSPTFRSLPTTQPFAKWKINSGSIMRCPPGPYVSFATAAYWTDFGTLTIT